MKGSKLHNINPALNKWEEENYAKLMAKKIKGAKSVVSANKTSSSPSKAAIHSSSSRSGSPAVGIRSTVVTRNSKQSQPASTQQPQQQPTAAAAVAAAGEILGKLHELLQLPLLQQLQLLQLPTKVSSDVLVQQTPVPAPVPQSAWAADAAVMAAEQPAADSAASINAGSPSLPSTATSSAKQDTSILHAAANGTQGGCSHVAAVISPQELIRIAHAATALLQISSPSTADTITSNTIAKFGTAAVQMPSSGGRQGHTSSKPGSSSGRKPKPSSRGNSRDDRRATKPQKAQAAWDEHWWETPPNDSADGASGITGKPQQQQQRQQQQKKKPRPGKLMPARTTSPAIGCRAASQKGTSAATGWPNQEQCQAQGSSNNRMLSKQSSAREGAGSKTPADANQGGAVGRQERVEVAVQPRRQSGPNAASNSKVAAAAALARLRGGSTTSAVAVIAPADTDNEFKVKLLPVRPPADSSNRCITISSSNGEVQARQTALDGIQQPGSRESSAGGSRRFSEGTHASISSRSCNSPARYSNVDDGVDSPRSEGGSSAETASTPASRTGGAPSGAVADPQYREPAARAAAASPAEVDVLTSSLMTLNDLIRHKVRDLQQQQQQQQVPRHSMQEDLHHHHHQKQQQCRGLGSDSGDLMGLSMQQSELLLMPGEADLLGMSDLAFLERGQQAHCTAESGSMNELQRQQQPDLEQLRPQQHGVASCGRWSEASASAGATAQVSAAAATAAEDDDMVLLGTLPGSFTAVAGAAGLEALCNILVTARGPSTNAIPMQHQTVSDSGVQQGLQDVQRQQQRPGHHNSMIETSAAEGVGKRCECSQSSQPEGRSSQGDDYVDDWEERSEAGSELLSENELMHQEEQQYDEGQLHQLQQSVELQRQAEQLTEGLQQLQLLVEGSRNQL